MTEDRVGLAWRPELAAGIHLHPDRIDALEVIADHWFRAGRREQSMLRGLARERPLYLHGVGLGLASAMPVDAIRADRMARLVGAVQPAGWSEHLAFVRAGGIEIGHLAAPPRSQATIDGAIANIRRAARIVGLEPQLENIATLLEPPCSTHDEASWIDAITEGAQAPFLLDLHNLYANARNRNEDPLALLARMPLDRVRCVHLSGGRWINAPSGAQRLLDDHLHSTPPAVFGLLEALAARVSQPLTVIIERDGRYPPIEALLAELDEARRSLARGRTVRDAHPMRRAA